MFGLHVLWWCFNGLIENDQMTNNNLHVKLKPAVKVFLINYLLTCTGQNNTGKAFKLLATLSSINFRFANTCSKYFLRKQSFDQRPCKMASFTNEQGELTILTTKHGLLVTHTKQKVCLLTTNHGQTNLLSYKSENLFSDHKSEGHQDLLPYHNSRPLAFAELQNILS